MRAYDGLDVTLLASSLLPGSLQRADGDAEIPVRKAAIEAQAFVNLDFVRQRRFSASDLRALGRNLVLQCGNMAPKALDRRVGRLPLQRLIEGALRIRKFALQSRDDSTSLRKSA